MRTSVLGLIAAGLLALPVGAEAQNFAVAGRAGTLGIGAEGALGLGPNVAVRAGIGLMPFEFDATIDDIDYTLELPESWYNIGVDVYLAGGLRIGGGLLFKSDDPSAIGQLNTNVEIGGETFTPEQVGTLTGTLDSSDQAPYVILGFGRHVASGIGLFLDLGVAFTGDPDVVLDAEEGTLSDDPAFRARLEAEERSFEDDVPTYATLWPILNLGIKIGLGG